PRKWPRRAERPRREWRGRAGSAPYSPSFSSPRHGAQKTVVRSTLASNLRSSSPAWCHGCPVEQVRLFVARPTQPGIPVAGLVPAIHAFFPFDGALGEDVGGRDKPGHGGSKVVYFSAVPPWGCDQTL